MYYFNKMNIILNGFCIPLIPKQGYDSGKRDLEDKGRIL
jgi:hypothetical protein